MSKLRAPWFIEWRWRIRKIRNEVLECGGLTPLSFRELANSVNNPKRRQAGALLCECPVGGPNIMLAALTSRETDCYSWHDSMVRHTLVDTARSKAKPSALGSLSPETKLPVHLRLIVL